MNPAMSEKAQTFCRFRYQPNASEANWEVALWLAKFVPCRHDGDLAMIAG